MRRRLATVFLASIVLLIGGTVLFVRSEMAAEIFCDRIERHGGALVDGTVSIEQCHIDPVSMELTFHGLTVVSEGRGLEATAERVGVRFRSIQGLSDMTLDELEIVRPRVVWTATPGGAGLGEDGLGKGRAGCGLPAAIGRVASARIVDGEVLAILDEGKAVHVEGISLDGRRRGRRQLVELAVAHGELRFGEEVEPLDDLVADIELDPAGSAIAVHRSSFSTGDLALSLQGRVADLCDPSLTASVAASGGLPRVFDLVAYAGAKVPAEGRFRLAARVSGTPWAPKVDGSLQIMGGEIMGIDVGDVEAEVSVTRAGVDMERVRFTVLGGVLDVGGHIGFSPEVPAVFDVQGQDVSLAAVVKALGRPGSWVDATVRPTGRIEGPLYPLRLVGRAEARVDRFLVLGRYVADGPPKDHEKFLDLPSTRIEGDLEITMDALAVSRARLVQGGSRLTANGRFPLDPRVPLDVAIGVERLELAPLGPLAQTAYGGVLTGEASLTGPYHDPLIVADVEMEGFEFAGLRAGDGGGRLRYRGFVLGLEGMRGRLGRTRYALDRFVLDMGARPRPTLEMRVSSDEARLEEIIEAFTDFHWLAREFRGVRGRARGSVGLGGPLGRFTMDVNATASDGVVFKQPFARARASLRLVEMERFEIDELMFVLDDEDALLARGWAVIGGPLALSLSAREVPSRRIFFADDLPLSGRISGDLVMEGTWDHPKGRGVGLMLDTELSGIPLAPARVRLALDKSRLHVAGHLSEDQVTGEGWIDIDGRYGFFADLAFDEPRLERWLPLERPSLARLADWRAEASGRARLEGLAGDLSSISGDVVVERFEARGDGLLVQSRGPVETSLASGGFAIRRLVLAGPESEISLSGVRRAGGNLDLAVRGGAGLELLEILVPSLSHARGRLTVEASVGGTVSAPTLVGAARVDGGEIRAGGLPLTLHALEGPLSFSQNRVMLDGLTGVLGSGRIVLDGEVALQRLLPERLHVHARVDDVRLRIPEDLHTTVAGDLHLIGPPDALTLGGDVEVLRGRWVGEMEIDQILPNLRRRTVAAAPSGERRPALNFDLRLMAPGTLVVDNRTARGRLSADLRLVGNDVRPGLIGTVSVNEGVARFRGNEFEVTRGVVEFHDVGRITPAFDLMAESEIREYRVAVHAYGTPSDPRLALSSDPHLPETDLVTLLTLGLTAYDAEGLGDSAAAAAADALFAMSGLDRHVRDFIPDNPILRDPSVRLTSGYSVRAGQVSPRLAFESSVFVDALRLRYSAPIGIPGQKTQAEYKITDVISAQAEWDTEGRRTTTVGNLGVDLKLRWEMD
jgi:translocation and assembly module TamB